MTNANFFFFFINQFDDHYSVVKSLLEVGITKNILRNLSKLLEISEIQNYSRKRKLKYLFRDTVEIHLHVEQFLQNTY